MGHKCIASCGLQLLFLTLLMLRPLSCHRQPQAFSRKTPIYTGTGVKCVCRKSSRSRQDLLSVFNAKPSPLVPAIPHTPCEGLGHSCKAPCVAVPMPLTSPLSVVTVRCSPGDPGRWHRGAQSEDVEMLNLAPHLYCRLGLNAEVPAWP